MAHTLQDQVVVITGASSGIGRAAALAFAREGAHVVVGARRESLLQQVAAECERTYGRDALAVATDVTDEAAVQELARRAYERFGHIDVWINNAGIGAFGRFEDIPSDVYRQVIETHLFGTTYGARAVLPYFRRQGHGVLINNASMLATTSAPYYTAYAASKFAIRALGEALRDENELLDKADIHVCTVMPASIDTPFFRHAANYTGRAVQPPPPVYSAERVAATMVRCAKHPQEEVFVGNSGRMIGAMHAIVPPLAERMFTQQVELSHFKPESAPSTPGNTFSPMESGTETSDGWHGQEKTNTRRAAVLGLASLTPAALAAVWLLRRRRAD